MDSENLMENLLKNKIDFPILNYYFNGLSEMEQNEFIEMIRNMDRDKLYKSPIHGVYHSEKVCLFAYLLGKRHQLDEVDMQILTDAAMYHDFKRESDFEDSFHGMVSAEHIEEILPREAVVYSIRVNLLLLKAIIDYHSQKDSRLRCNFEMYELPEEEFSRYEHLAKLLKDADALDRTRFSEKCVAALNPELLRYSESSLLIPLAEEVNEAYNQMIEKNQSDDIPLDMEKGDCFHSIGFDFFRIRSILMHGILSFSEMQKEGLIFPRNFDGGNANRWISVVPATTVKNDDTAFKMFIENGIAFYCPNQIFYYPMEFNKKATAKLKGLPYDKSGYLDERYVFSKIEPSDIISIFVTKEHANKDVRELSYLYNTLYYQRLEDKIVYLLNQMEISSIDEVPTLIEPLARYKKELHKYEIADFMERIMILPELNRTLNTILLDINDIVQNIVHDYYAARLGRSPFRKITVKDVVNYEVSSLYHESEIEIIEGDEELLFVINRESQKKKYKK